jgi:hypothetical protein
VDATMSRACRTREAGRLPLVVSESSDVIEGILLASPGASAKKR